MNRPYHHGDLRRALLAAAVDAVLASGPSGMSLREVSRRAGVSHAAPAHHFGDKAGLLTALAAEGFGAFGDALDAASGGRLLDFGVAYVRFAIERRAHFEVMFRPELLHRDDPVLVERATRAREILHREALRHAPAGRDPDDVALALWSLVHGFASLAGAGNLPVGDDVDLTALAARIIDAVGLVAVVEEPMDGASAPGGPAE